MTEYIDKEALRRFPIRLNHYDKEHGNEHFVLGIESVLEYAESLPAADVAEVRHGVWIKHNSYVECPFCGAMPYNNSNYCPHCGAKMDGKSDDNDT